MAFEQYIRQAAIARGIDPDIAVRVARSEGGVNDYIQSKVRKNGVQEPSYGPFQLLVGGQGTIFPEGMGNQMIRETGLDPRDPNNAHASIDFALDQAKNKGWGQWYGAKAIGVTGKHGIGSQVAAQQSSAPQASGTPAPAMGEPITVGSSPVAQPAGGIMGAFAPNVTAQAPQLKPSIMGGISDLASGNFNQGAEQLFGSMNAGGGSSNWAQALANDQAMQLQPMQGANPQQAAALSNFLTNLTRRRTV